MSICRHVLREPLFRTPSKPYARLGPLFRTPSKPCKTAVADMCCEGKPYPGLLLQTLEYSTVSKSCVQDWCCARAVPHAQMEVAVERTM